MGPSPSVNNYKQASGLLRSKQAKKIVVISKSYKEAVKHAHILARQRRHQNSQRKSKQQEYNRAQRRDNQESCLETSKETNGDVPRLRRMITSQLAMLGDPK